MYSSFYFPLSCRVRLCFPLGTIMAGNVNIVKGFLVELKLCISGEVSGLSFFILLTGNGKET